MFDISILWLHIDEVNLVECVQTPLDNSMR